MEDNFKIQGKLQPQATDIEDIVLGSMMLENRTINQVRDLITPNSFYKPVNQIICTAIFTLNQQNDPVDLMTVTEQLKKINRLKGVGGAFAITMLTSRVASTANIEYYAAIIREKHILREIIRLTSEIQTQAFNNADCFDLIVKMQDHLSSLSGFDRGNVKHITDIFPEILQQIDRNMKNNGVLTGIETGFNYFDKHSNGLQNGDLVIIAGETSNGKTSLALIISWYAAKLNHKVAIYSYEMSSLQIVSRILAFETSVSSKDVLYSKLNDNQLSSVNSGIGNLSEQFIFIDDLHSSKYDYLERSIRSMVLRENVELVIIDYLQLIQTDSRNKMKHDQVAQIANDLKNLAKTLNIPIILVSQLSRDRNNPRPSLSRLKGSGDIENAADIVWFVWQPIMYNHYDFECQDDTIDSEGNSHHIIAKGRNIGTTEFPLGFTKHLTKFTNELN